MRMMSSISVPLWRRLRPRVSRTHVLETTQFVQRPRDDVFAFFADPENLEAITPGALRFEIVTPQPIAMRVGALIEYRLRLLGVGFSWLTRIEVFEPGRRFVDVQVQGPYRSWRHTHEFADAPGGTLVRDRVEYELPLGPLGELAHALFVRGRLKRIFAFRRQRIAELLVAAPAR
jgi:ligand-binding SRPBCC domain-containing protein